MQSTIRCQRGILNNFKLKNVCSMKASLNTYPSGIGDCVTLQLSDNEGCYNILIDCGCMTAAVEDVICNQWGKHINLLVVTHIDSDHIHGLIQLLNTHEDLIIDKIWFNSYQREPEGQVEELTEKQKKILSALATHLSEKDLIGVINEKGAVTLSEQILGNANWKSAWEREYVVQGKELSVNDGRLGKITVIAPTVDMIEKLDKKFIRLFKDKFFAKKMKDYSNDSSIYELLIRLADEEDELMPEENEAGAGDYTKTSLQSHVNDAVEDITDANKASLAFVWEKNNHSILFLGDACPVIVANYLKEKYANECHLFDAIKVAHHGSNHNTTNDLMRCIDSSHYFFTGGRDDDRPGLACLARIVSRDLPAGVDTRTLHFNKKTNHTEGLTKANDAKGELKFDTTYTNSYEIEA